MTKKLWAVLLCLALVIALTGCIRQAPVLTAPTTEAAASTAGTQAAEETTPSEATVPTSAYQAPLAAIALPVVEEVTQEGGGTVFTYSFQNVHLTLQDPEVADAVVLDLMNRIDATRSAAEALLASAQAAFDPSGSWTPYSFQVRYEPTRIDQGVLSLCGSQDSYAGSPHPSHASVSVTYDLVTGKALSFWDVFREDFSADRLLELTEEALSGVKDQLYSGYETVLSDLFTGNTAPENWYFSQAGLCLYFSPYELAPYAVGTVTAEIPYGDLAGLLKDGYFPPETSAVSGKMAAAPFDSENMNDIRQFAELVLDAQGQRYLLLAEGTVRDVRIRQGLMYSGGFIPDTTVFAAEALSAGDAIMLQTDLLEGPFLSLTYMDGGTQVQALLSPGEDGSLTLSPLDQAEGTYE